MSNLAVCNFPLGEHQFYGATVFTNNNLAFVLSYLMAVYWDNDL
jgi:hypothetical protein